VRTSCGYGIPIYDLKNERDTLSNWNKRKAEKGEIETYQQENNLFSIDGLSTDLMK
jgi:hypothetical protein